MSQLIKGTGRPVRIFYEGEGDTYKPVKGSRCEWEIKVQDPAVRNFLINMFGAVDDMYRIRVYKNDELYWIGSVVNDFYFEQFNKLPFTAKVVAEDGLGRLQNIPFVDDNNAPLTGYASMVDIILICLNKLNLELPLITADAIRATIMDDTDPLNQALIDMSVFVDRDGDPLSCYDVLEQILKKKAITIRQAFAPVSLLQPLQPLVVSGSNSSPSHIFALDRETGEPVIQSDTEEHGTIYEIDVDGSGNIFAITYHNGENAKIIKWNQNFVKQWETVYYSGEPNGIAADREGNVWVGTENVGVVFKIDGEDGSVLFSRSSGLPRMARGSIATDYLNRVHIVSWRFSPKPEGMIVSYTKNGDLFARTYEGGFVFNKYLAGSDGVAWGNHIPLVQHQFRFTRISFDPVRNGVIVSFRSRGFVLFRHNPEWRHGLWTSGEETLSAWVNDRRVTPAGLGDIYIPTYNMARRGRDGLVTGRAQVTAGLTPTTYIYLMGRNLQTLQSMPDMFWSPVDDAFILDENDNLYINIREDTNSKIKKFSRNGEKYNTEPDWTYEHGPTPNRGLAILTGRFGGYPEKFLDKLVLWLQDELNFGAIVEDRELSANLISYYDKPVQVTLSIIGDGFSVVSDSVFMIEPRTVTPVTIIAESAVTGTFEAEIKAGFEGLESVLTLKSRVFDNVFFGVNTVSQIRVRMLNPDDGSQLAQTATAVEVGGEGESIAVDRVGDIYISTNLGFVMKFSGIDLSLVWSQEIEAKIDGSQETCVCVDNNGDILFKVNRSVYKLNPTNGAEIWRAEDTGDHTNYLRSNIRSMVVTPDGEIYTVRNTSTISNAGVVSRINADGNYINTIINPTSSHIASIDYDPMNDVIIVLTLSGVIRFYGRGLEDATGISTFPSSANNITQNNLFYLGAGRTGTEYQLTIKNELLETVETHELNSLNNDFLAIDQFGNWYSSIRVGASHGWAKFSPNGDQKYWEAVNNMAEVVHIFGRRSTYPDRFPSQSKLEASILLDTDFSKYALTSSLPLVPDEWTRHGGGADGNFSIVEDAGALGGIHLEHHYPNTDILPLLIFKSDNIENILLRGRFKTPEILDSNSRIWVPFRFVDTANYYYLDIRQNIQNFTRALNGTFSTIGANNFVPNHEPDTYYWFEVQMIGARMLHKVWKDGDDEPTEWSLQRFDTSFAAGKVGIGGRHSINRWDYYKITELREV